VLDVPRHERIPSCNAISKRVDDFTIHSSVVNKPFFGPTCSIHTPQNNEQVREVI
jgi:hypothetical protein